MHARTLWTSGRVLWTGGSRMSRGAPVLKPRVYRPVVCGPPLAVCERCPLRLGRLATKEDSMTQGEWDALGIPMVWSIYKGNTTDKDLASWRQRSVRSRMYAPVQVEHIAALEDGPHIPQARRPHLAVPGRQAVPQTAGTGGADSAEFAPNSTHSRGWNPVGDARCGVRLRFPRARGVARRVGTSRPASVALPTPARSRAVRLCCSASR